MEYDPELCEAANVIANLNKEFSDLQDENAVLRNNILHITKILNKPEVLINTKEEWRIFSLEVNNIKLLIENIHSSEEFYNMINLYGPIDVIWRCYYYTEEEDILPDYNNYRSDRLYYPIVQHMKKLTNHLNDAWIEKKFEDTLVLINDIMNIICEKTEIIEYYGNWVYSELFSSILIHNLIINNEGIFSDILDNLRYYKCNQCLRQKKTEPNSNMMCYECSPF
jgi:hypothetical protein